jgi:glycosyltransferase involved in cell wall biosynthesis
MKIGINTLWVVPGEVGGAEYYLTNLLQGLVRRDTEHRVILFVTPLNEGICPALPANFRKVVLPFSNSNRKLRILYEQLVLPVLARREALDVLHSPDNMSAPRVKTCGLVQTLQYLHCFFFRAGLPRFKMAAVRNHLRRAVHLADHVITPSRSTREEALSLFRRLPPDRITSIPDYVSIPALFPGGLRAEEAVLRRYGIRRPYLFSPSSLYPYKNIEGMLHTLQDLRRNHRFPHGLVVAGRDDISYYAETRRLADRLGVGDAYHYLGPVPHEQVPSLYAYADCTFYPSRSETFGIPVLESMAAGTPVVCSSRSSMPEVAGGAAVLVDPESVEEMSRAIRSLLSDPEQRRRLRELGRERAGQFHCETAAEKTVEIYTRVHRKRQGNPVC